VNATIEQSQPAATREEAELRVLVLAPTGQDGPLTLELIRSAGLTGEACRGVFDVCHSIDQGCGVLVLAEEGLATSSLSVLLECLNKQPSWSDLPIVVVTSSGDETDESRRILNAVGTTSHLAIIERPFRRSTLLSALDVAIRSRKRQYAVRDLLAEQERIARSLARSEESLRLAIEATQLGAWDFDLVSGELNCSVRCKELFGLPANAKVDYQIFLSGLHPDDRARVDSTAQTHFTATDDSSYETEYRMIGLRDGVERWIRSSGRPHFGIVDGQRRPVRLIGTVQDITQRKRIEQSLRQQNERLELLSDALSHLLKAQKPKDMVREVFRKVADHLRVDTYFNFLVDESGTRLILHSAAGLPQEVLDSIKEIAFGEAICGTVAQIRQPIVATHIQESSNPKAQLVRRFGIRAYACQPLITGEHLIGTLSFASRTRDTFTDDEVRFIELISQYVSIAMDRTRSEQALRAANENLEREVQARTAKLRETVGELEAFSYSITHDMRAPLRAMQGFAIALQDEAASLTPDCRDYVRRIVNSANRMDQLITDVLNYSRSLRADMELKVVDFKTLTLGILESYPQFQAANVQVLLEGAFPKVRANEAALTQCISNLLNNAVKFVNPGTDPRVRIWAENTGPKVRFWFEDNGIGIKKEYQEKIWGLFQKLNRGFEGTGLGLAIVRKAADRMGGSVGVESETGTGSRFWLELQASH
jgi:PAS domain S-box-containing protein